MRGNLDLVLLMSSEALFSAISRANPRIHRLLDLGKSLRLSRVLGSKVRESGRDPHCVSRTQRAVREGILMAGSNALRSKSSIQSKGDENLP
jgi:hypothetical protein